MDGSRMPELVSGICRTRISNGSFFLLFRNLENHTGIREPKKTQTQMQGQWNTNAGQVERKTQNSKLKTQTVFEFLFFASFVSVFHRHSQISF
jgi:nitrate reductase beta subunit